MATPRTALRGLGVLAAASGLALAGAGVASATTSEHSVDGTTVTVDFALEEGDAADVCGAALVPPAAAAGILGNLGGGEVDLGNIFDSLEELEGVHVLKDGLLPTANLIPVVSPTGTLTAENVPSNVYLLVTLCGSDPSTPGTDVVLVGNPLEAIGGLSSAGLLETGSALLQGGEGTGQLDLGTLSSALGGATE